MNAAVLINNYNQAPFLRACVDSVLSQTRPASEIIAYDDGSSDESLEILRSYGSAITVIAGTRTPGPSRINQGNAIHQAFLRSTAEAIFLLDGDDVFYPRRIERYLDAFAANTIMVQAPLTWIDARGEIIPRLAEPFKHASDPLAAVYQRQDPDFAYPTSALAFHRSFLERALPIDWTDGLNLWTDTRLAMAALLSGRVATLDEELGGWRRHTHSDSVKQNADSRLYLLRQTSRRTAVFNQLCRQAGRPKISLWRNSRFYRQLLRAALPALAYDLYARRIQPPELIENSPRFLK